MTVLITGGTKGIGLAAAKRLATNSRQVFLGYSSDDDAAKQAKEDLLRLGARPVLVKQDLSEPEGYDALVARVSEEAAEISTIVHCAVKPVTGDLMSVDIPTVRRSIDTNGLGILYLCRAASPILHVGSSVVFLSSQGGQRVIPGYGLLGASKALGECIVRYLSYELGPRGVRVNTVMAGPLDTEAFRAMFPQNSSERLESARHATPAGRELTTDDVARVINFLTSGEGDMVHGQVVTADGGLYLR